MSDVLIARQPVFDSHNQLAGYQILYRPTSAGAGELARDRTLVSALVTIGLEQLVGEARAFVHLSRDLLLEHAFDLLDPSAVTIELLHPAACDEELLAAVRALRARGFGLSVGDFAVADEYRELLHLAQLVRIDVLHHTADELTGLARQLQGHPVQLLAEQVETAESADACKAMGFAFFQGPCFSRAQIVKRRDMPVGMTGIARLMNMVLDPRVNDRAVEDAFRADPGLSFQLLRIVNSAAVGGKGIESIQHAIRLLGRAALHRWLSLLLMAAVPRGSGVEQEMVVTALARGRLCELLALNSGRGRAAPSLFLTGLLSSFDAILGIPIRELLHQVRVAPEVASALLHQEGPFTPYLTLATLYETGAWNDALVLASELGVEDDLPVWYVQAGGWARNILAH